MGVQTVLNRLVVVGNDRQNGVRAARFSVFGQLDGVGDGIAAGSRNDRYAAMRDVDRDADEDVMLRGTQPRRLAGRAADHESGRAHPDLEFA